MSGMTRGIALALVGGALLVAACGEPGADGGEAGVDTTGAALAGDTVIRVPASAGLQTPESVLHDPEADVYLVSNINGQPTARDGNGFIARVRPDGTIEALKWIDGAAEGVSLNAPKGMGLKGDTLFVADIDSLRAFHRTTGEPLGARGVPGASFLNDVAVGGDAVYVTDTGVDASFASTGNGAIYRFGGTGLETIARGDALSNPNGIVVQGDVLHMVPFGAAQVRRFDLPPGAVPPADEGGGQAASESGGAPAATLPGGQLDGIVGMDDGAFLVSSWETSTVYHVTPDGQAHPVVQDIASPADIGWDAGRRRVLIPVFMENRLELHPIR